MSLRVLPNENGNSGILFLGFNQDNEFNVKDGTGIGYIEMLYRTSFIGLLGGGTQARLPPTVACIWEGGLEKFILELSYRTQVKSIKLRRDRIIVVLYNEIRVYSFNSKPELFHQSETIANPLGLCHVCQSPSNPLLSFPGTKMGVLVLVNIGQQSKSDSSVQHCPPPRQIIAHENDLVALTMDDEGRHVATASIKGTLIRIFDTTNCQLKHVLRRGTNPAVITSLCFSKSAHYFCVTSNHGTIHIYSLKNPNSGSNSSLQSNHSSSSIGSSRNRSGNKGASSLIPKYFTNVSSQVKIMLDTQYKCICVFSSTKENTLIVLAANGSYYKYTFNINGVANRDTYVNFLDFYDDLDL